ncbi:MAG TPA: hypothetical protein VHN58_04750, partial [Croceicoccus sp.]|nr:hypothetical protein [Croceicoccus sp.]
MRFKADAANKLGKKQKQRRNAGNGSTGQTRRGPGGEESMNERDPGGTNLSGKVALVTGAG